jgi:ABC-2 type transport system permease protein
MKQFFTVFKFELIGQLRSKTFIVITAILVVGILFAVNLGRIEKVFGGEDGFNFGKDEDTVMLIKNESEFNDDELLATFKTMFSDGYKVSLTDKTQDQLKKTVKSGDADSAVVIKAPLEYTYIVDTVGMYDADEQIINQAMITSYRYLAMAQSGMSEEDIAAVLSATVDSDVIVTGKDQTQSFLYTYIIIMILYMVLLLYGQFVASSVASEKSTRCMEVLITSSKPMNLMFGKVLGSGCAGLLQLVLILGTAVVGFRFNEKYIDNEMLKSLFGVPTSVAVYTVVFFILGYFIYAFMYGAAGSLVSRVEDLSTLIMPVTFLFMAAFLASVFGMTGGSVDGTLYTVLSFLPTFAPLVMLVRVCMGSVPTWQIAVSIAIQAVSVGVLGVLCARIYRAGVLLYGNKPKLEDILKILKPVNT